MASMATRVTCEATIGMRCAEQGYVRAVRPACGQSLIGWALCRRRWRACLPRWAARSLSSCCTPGAATCPPRARAPARPRLRLCLCPPRTPPSPPLLAWARAPRRRTAVERAAAARERRRRQATQGQGRGCIQAANWMGATRRARACCSGGRRPLWPAAAAAPAARAPGRAGRPLLRPPPAALAAGQAGQGPATASPAACAWTA